MALGLPVIGTRAAFEGIPAENRVQAFITDDAAEFAGAAANILLDPELAESTGAAARKFVQAWCAREPVMLRWKEEYARAVEHFRAGNKDAGSGS